MPKYVVDWEMTIGGTIHVVASSEEELQSELGLAIERAGLKNLEWEVLSGPDVTDYEVEGEREE